MLSEAMCNAAKLGVRDDRDASGFQFKSSFIFGSLIIKFGFQSGQAIPVRVLAPKPKSTFKYPGPLTKYI